MKVLPRISCFVIFFLFYSLSLQAQQKDLKPEDYGQWQQITTTELSDNGQWFAYNISVEDDDGWLMLKSTDSDQEHKFMYGSNPTFSDDNRWFAFHIGVSEEKQEELEEQDQPVKQKLGLMNLSTAVVDTIPNISGFEFSDDGSHLVMQKYPPEEAQTEGRDIIIRNLQNETNQLYGNVADYKFNEAGSHLAFTIDATEKLGNGVHLLNLESNSVQVLESDTTTYKHLNWNEDGDALTFMKERKDEDYENPTHLIFAFKNVTDNPQKTVYDQREDEQFPDDHRIVEYRNLQWSDDSQTVFFGIQEWKKAEEVKPESETDSTNKALNEDLDPTNVEVWHWQDDPIQPQQKVMMNNEKEFNYLSAWHLNNHSFVQLGEERFDLVQLTGDQKHAVAYDPTPYQPVFEEEWNDVYLIDTQTGDKETVLERHEYLQTSPGGDYLYYFKDNNWWTYNISDGSHINITEDIDTRFENYHTVDGREQLPPFGTGQWGEDDDWLLVYDEFDIYRIAPDGSDYTKLTNGAEDEIRHRQNRLDNDKDYLADTQPIYIALYGEYTKKHGYGRLDEDDNLEELIYESRMFNRLNKAEDTDTFIFSRESATESPNFYMTDVTFEDFAELTSTNPQQDNYHWADDELITFENERGEKLQGRLLYPANYDPDKTYPMITYIYERRSQTMHNYTPPSRKSAYNQRRYSSEGYFVFEPDITYELRKPGKSAVESVVPAVEKVLETGMINEDQIGLTGHSWGAYQTAFIITQTDIFNSAVAGAPLTNMISMYNSVYWNSGTPDAQIFETSQGRFPDPYWQDWDKYIENSPIFNMEDAETPLLVEFGTDDGAVDFNQGVELYNTMRRMEKPYVMLVYEGENHGLAREENQIDYAKRAFQWHEHYLKGKEAPDWIKEGLPYIERPALSDE